MMFNDSKKVIEKNNVDYDLGLIVAMGENREIGYKQNLIWQIKEYLQYFKRVTMNSYIIMGRNTYLSLPKKLFEENVRLQ